LGGVSNLKKKTRFIFSVVLVLMMAMSGSVSASTTDDALRLLEPYEEVSTSETVSVSGGDTGILATYTMTSQLQNYNPCCSASYSIGISKTDIVIDYLYVKVRTFDENGVAVGVAEKDIQQDDYVDATAGGDFSVTDGQDYSKSLHKYTHNGTTTEHNLTNDQWP
jgi:hypothetical protein